jgi:hypothetical protein
MQSNQSSPEERKSGRLSLDEMEYIDQNRGHMPPDEIALFLRRNVETIDKHIRKYPNGFKSKSKKQKKRKSQNELRPTGVLLDQVKAELTRSEMKKFQEMWRELIKQFKYDVLFSEQKQIKDWIIFQIRADREAIKQKILIEQESDISEQLEREESSPTPDKQEINRLNTKLMDVVAQIGESERLFQKYHEIQTEIGKDLVIKRDQRIKSATDGKKNFVDLIKFLREDEERNKEGRAMVLLNMAADQALQRLGENHVYGDGSTDRPIYSVETIRDEDQLLEKDIDE